MVMAVLASVVVLEEPLKFFFRVRLGPSLVRAESQAIIKKDSVGSPTDVSQSTVVSIIANQTPFKAGGLQHSLHEWKKITSEPFYLRCSYSLSY